MRIRHPVAGLLDFSYESLTIPGDGEQTLLGAGHPALPAEYREGWTTTTGTDESP